jgi:PAS domain S-box-containing protein
LVYHLAALVEISGDAIVSQTLDGTILSWNKGAQRLYGYSVDDVRGHSIGILSPMDHGEELRMVLGQVKRGEKVTPFETLHQAKNGRLVRALVKAAAVHDSLHRVIGVSFCAQELPAPATSSTAIPLTDTLQKS